MARRMTDTAKWDDDWFMNLSAPTKLLWFYLCDQCDHAGIWKVNRRLAEFKIGSGVDWDSSRTELGDRITEIDEGRRWHIRKFVEFQYGSVYRENNKAHQGVLKALSAFSLPWGEATPPMPLPSPLIGAKEKELELDKDSRGGAGGDAPSTKERFRGLLVRLIVADGPAAAKKWWALACSSPRTKCFEDQCDLVAWCVCEGRKRGLVVSYASHVVNLVPEWRPRPEAETA